MGIQYIDTDAGRLVVVPEADYRKLVELSADAEAGHAIDDFRRKLAAGEEELVPADIAKRLIGGENPVRVWRQHREMSSGDLAQAAGLSQAFVSQIETGKRAGSIGAMKAIADALAVTLDDLV
jgi:DNA-binding XRE family transcriptional regulator